MFAREDRCALSREQIEEKAEALLNRMTLEEKVLMLSGNWDVLHNVIRYRRTHNAVPYTTNGCPRLGVSRIAFTDGPRGVAVGRSTCFPVSMARGASFDRDLERRVGEVIGKEARAQGANLVACVCINLLRHPAWGRSQETYGEDTFHVGEMGRALPRVLFGDVNPSGKLPFSIPQDESHLPHFSSTDAEITYDMYHGYTLLEKEGHKPAYPFGFGRSYTTWEYGELQLQERDGCILVSVGLRNTGSTPGAEVVQVYVGMKQSQVDRPRKLLRGFEKVYLEPGQSEEVEILVEIDDLRYFDSKQGRWTLEPGIYLFYVGSSSDDASLQVKEIELSLDS